MPRYQKINLATNEPIGEPGPLPDALFGLADDTLADLSRDIDPVPVEWVGIGFIYFDDPPPPVPVPSAVDLRQAKLKLYREGVLDTVESMITSSGDVEVAIEWTTAREVRRDHPFVNAAQLILGKTNAEMDQWFIEASQIGPMGSN
ncbi:hypothetical protein [Caulobacter henricii]|uniref:Uncharacterized protein n=1 Tax=Caulobacter henricii TaxID=69395 RepID=A0A0P0P1S9_9CAUL|nr:hypothetical protein [Caulobacter henricii]ALL14251.1 hypothetical protein AQ619_13375 [Caulobacter henricii]